MKNETITSLANLFYASNSGNDCYCIRYYLVKSIYFLAGEAFPSGEVNDEDLYNLQYNYDRNSGDRRNVMEDFKGMELLPQELEKRLQEYLNKLYLLLAKVLIKYEYCGSFGFK